MLFYISYFGPQLGQSPVLIHEGLIVELFPVLFHDGVIVQLLPVLIHVGGDSTAITCTHS